jgi:DNA-directed RNA polymerase specialized sigma24 family protein
VAIVPRAAATATGPLPMLLFGHGLFASARDQLFERVYERVLAIVRGRLGTGLRRFHESGDVVQEALLQAVRSLGQVQIADEAALLSWLASVVETVS